MLNIHVYVRMSLTECVFESPKREIDLLQNQKLTLLLKYSGVCGGGGGEH